MSSSPAPPRGSRRRSKGTRTPLGRRFAGRTWRSAGRSRSRTSIRGDILNPLLRRKGVKSLLGIPLAVEQQVIGVLHVGSLSARRFTRAEATILQLVADRAALPIEHARLFEEEQRARLEWSRSSA